MIIMEANHQKHTTAKWPQFLTLKQYNKLTLVLVYVFKKNWPKSTTVLLYSLKKTRVNQLQCQFMLKKLEKMNSCARLNLEKNKSKPTVVLGYKTRSNQMC